MTHLRRCSWCGSDPSLYVACHDGEWGVPVADSRGPAALPDWLGDPDLIRHRGKLEALIANAHACRALDGSFSELVSSFLANAPKQNHRYGTCYDLARAWTG